MSGSASITVRVPLAIRRRPGQKTIVTPEGAATPPSTRPRAADPALVKALARAHRWQRMLEDGRYASISEMAAAEKLDRGYLGRVLRLTLLAPDIVQTILDGPAGPHEGVATLLDPLPAAWPEQRRALSLAVSARRGPGSWRLGKGGAGEDGSKEDDARQDEADRPRGR